MTTKTRKDAMKDALAEGARLGVAGGVNNSVIQIIKQNAGESWPPFFDTAAGQALLRMCIPLLLINTAPNMPSTGFITDRQAAQIQNGGEAMFTAAAAQDFQVAMAWAVQNLGPILQQVANLGESQEDSEPAQIEDKAEVEDIAAELDRLAEQQKVPVKAL